MKIELRPIGTVHSPFKKIHGTPIQPAAARGIKGKLVLEEKYVEGLKDLDGFSHIIIMYFFHLVKGYSLKVKPFMDNSVHGLFATRAPSRPNPIGISVVRLLSVTGNTVNIEDIDVVDGTPLLDIKPFVQEFSSRDTVKKGWLEKRVKDLPDKKDDGRFLK